MLRVIKQWFWNWIWGLRGKHSNEVLATGRPVRPDTPEFMAAICDDVIAKLSLDANDDLLDIGCGNGLFSKRFSEVSRHVTATDKIATMAEKAQKILQGTPNIEVIRCDANHVPKPDDSYSKIVCYSVIHYFMDDAYLLSFFKEVYRLLKPGGMALIADIPDKARLMGTYGKGILPRLRVFASRAVSRWFTQEEVLKLGREAGLQGEILVQSEKLLCHKLRFDLRLKKV